MNMIEMLSVAEPRWRHLYGDDPVQAAVSMGLIEEAEEPKPEVGDGYFPRTGDGERPEELYRHIEIAADQAVLEVRNEQETK